jgi:hypothetical protein
MKDLNEVICSPDTFDIRLTAKTEIETKKLIQNKI